MFVKVVAPLLAVFLAAASAGLVGGPMEVDLESNDVQNVLQFAVAQHNKASNDVFINKVSKVIKAETQVVAGLKYIFTVEMVRTSCKKGGVENVCDAHSNPDDAQRRECQLKVWTQPWKNTIKVTENTC